MFNQVGAPGIGLAAMIALDNDRFFQMIVRCLRPGLGLQRIRRCTGLQAERGIESVDQPVRTAGPVERIAEIMPAAAGPAHDGGKRVRPAGAQDQIHRFRRQGTQHTLARRVDPAGRLGLVERVEAGWRARFQREAPQQVFAEGVDGLDLQAAGRFQGTGKQAARILDLPDRQIFMTQLFLQVALELLRPRDRPAPQTGEETILHLGGGGLGVGDAEDFLRRDALEQDVHHAVDQDAGLARTGIGLHEDADAVMGGPLLGVGGGSADRVVETGRVHVSPSDPSGALAHSPRRARWSKSP